MVNHVSSKSRSYLTYLVTTQTATTGVIVLKGPNPGP